MSCSTVQLAGKAVRILLTSIGGARLAIELCPCDLDQNTRSKDRVRGQIRSFRAVAQLGRAPGSGPGGRGFKSHQPDELPPSQNVLLLRIAQREDQTTLVGSCENLADRIRRHNAGESKATKHGVRWIIIHTESFGTRSEAAKRERYYKSGRGREKLRQPAIERSPRRQARPSSPTNSIALPL